MCHQAGKNCIIRQLCLRAQISPSVRDPERGVMSCSRGPESRSGELIAAATPLPEERPRRASGTGRLGWSFGRRQRGRVEDRIGQAKASVLRNPRCLARVRSRGGRSAAMCTQAHDVAVAVSSGRPSLTRRGKSNDVQKQCQRPLRIAYGAWRSRPPGPATMYSVLGENYEISDDYLRRGYL